MVAGWRWLVKGGWSKGDLVKGARSRRPALCCAGNRNGGAVAAFQTLCEWAIICSMNKKSLIYIVSLVALLAGCTTVKFADRGESSLYVGVTRVIKPATVGDVKAVEVKSLGLGWDAGPYLGWKSGKWVAADPEKCQLLVVIRSPAQAKNAIDVLKTLKGQQPCLVDSTVPAR